MTESPFSPILVSDEDEIEEARRVVYTYDVEQQQSSAVEDNVEIEEGRQLVYDFEPLPTMKLPSGGYVSFRPFQASDREQVQELHEEWFPVRYKQEFYDHLVYQRMCNSGENLFTYAAVYHDDDDDDEDDNDDSDDDDDDAVQQIMNNKLEHAQGCSSSRCISSQDKSENEDSIVACVVGSFVRVSHLDNTTTSLLISNPSRYTRLFYIMTLGTETEFRHSRLATTLVKKCIQIVENDSQCGALYLHVITFNTAAIRLYERLGFYRVKEIEGKNNLVTYPCDPFL